MNKEIKEDITRLKVLLIGMPKAIELLEDILMELAIEIEQEKENMKNQKIIIPVSEMDLEELREGRTFNWTFTTDKGEDIDVELVNEELE